MSTTTASPFTQVLRPAGNSPSNLFLMKALFLKECRQLAPLFLALGGLTVMLQLFIVAWGPNNPQELQQGIAFLLPALFAIGAGAMLVSQEKELRTLQWLTSLPAPSYLLVLSKFLAAALGLVLIWCLSLSVGLAVQPELVSKVSHGLGPTYSSGIELTWKYIANSFFLLVAGFVSGWIFGSAWLAMVMVIPLAFIPTLLGNLSFFNDSPFQVKYRGYFDCLIYAISAMLLVPVGYYFGRGAFAAPSQNWLSGIQFRRRDRIVSTRISPSWRPWPSSAAALWQIGLQNRMLLAAGVALVLMPFVPLTFPSLQAGSREYRNSMELTVALYSLFVCWLGASVFASDGFYNRIRFLSDRGISPGLIWWSRILFPALSVVAFGVALVLTARWYLPADNPLTQQFYGPLSSWAVAFGISLWCTQWFRRPFLSFVVAPVVVLGAVIYFWDSILGTLGISQYWIIPAALVPPIASRVMLRPWMDGRFDLRVKLQHGAFALLILAIPMIPLLITYAVVPGMSRTARTDLRELLIHQPPMSVPVMVYEAMDHEPPEKDRQDWAGAVTEELKEPYVHPNGVVRSRDLYGNKLELAVAEARLMKLRMADEPQEEAWRKRYGIAIEAVWEISWQLRSHSKVLYQQERADRIEAWLVNEMMSPPHRECVPPSTYHTMIENLGNRARRNEARLNALAFTWGNQSMQYSTSIDTQTEFTNTNSMLGEPFYNTNPLLVWGITKGRKRDLAAEVLLRFIESGNRSAENPAYQRYLSMWPSMEGQIAAWYENSTEPNGAAPVPGLMWHGKWETDAEDLKRLLESQPKELGQDGSPG